MSEPEHENPTTTVEGDSVMDLDIDFETLLPFDQNYLFSPPSSPFLLSIFGSPSHIHPLLINSPEQQPLCPLWNFSDGDDEQLGGNSSSSLSGGLRILDCPRFIRSPESVTEKVARNEEKNGFLPSAMGMVPMDNPDLPCMIKERMTQALRYFKESTEQTVLAQVWAPIKNGDRYLLTTSGQPFVLDPHSNGLLQFRTVSLSYMFNVDGESDGYLGLPGRVFRQKLPEWTPNVQYYSKNEYPQLSYALHYNIRGTVALPVFESSGQSCVGVLELIMTSQKVNYAPEIDKVCKALEAVNLKSSEILGNPNLEICNEGRQHALAEILEILNVVCETYKLPLAQTWVPCRHRSVLADGGAVKKSCSSFDGSCLGQVCMSTTDVAFYVVDAHMWGFRDACAEHHLQKGQGVAGRAFSSHSSCFSRDITQFSKTEYPLAHYALMFGLVSCYAICLRSSYTGSDDYILEFFLPPSITDDSEQQDLLASLLATMKEHFQSLRVASEQDVEEQRNSVQIVEISTKDVMQASLRKTSGRRCRKTENSSSLEVLQQCFAGSLKDAAKSLGVFPVTLKRTCRHHGVSRWQSQKINTVNNFQSISKQKRVTESVKGIEAAAFSPTSLATIPLPSAVGSISWPVCSDGLIEQQLPHTISECQRRKEMPSAIQMTPQISEVLDNIYPNLQVLESENISILTTPWMGTSTTTPLWNNEIHHDDGSTLENRYMDEELFGSDELLEGVWDNEVDGANSVTNQDAFPIRVGDTFASAKEFRGALLSALIQVKKEVNFKKSEKKRVVAKCSSEGCNWRISAGAEQESKNIVVRRILGAHTCQRLDDSTNKLATSIWVSNKIVDRIRQNPEFQPKDIQAFIKSTYGVDIGYMTAYRAKERALKKIHSRRIQ